MAGLVVKTFVDEFDMRRWYSLGDLKAAMALRAGEVLVAINKKRTIWRWIDSRGLILYHKTDDGKAVDLEAFRALVRAGIKIDLTVGKVAGTKWKAKAAKRRRKKAPLRRAA